MTLTEWQREHNIRVYTHASNNTKFVLKSQVESDPRALWDLRHLTDYLVSTLVADVYWLVSKLVQEKDI